MAYKFHVRFDTLEIIPQTHFFICITAVVSACVVIVILKDLQSRLPMDKITAYKISRGLGFGVYVKSSSGRSGVCGCTLLHLRYPLN